MPRAPGATPLCPSVAGTAAQNAQVSHPHAAQMTQTHQNLNKTPLGFRDFGARGPAFSLQVGLLAGALLPPDPEFGWSVAQLQSCSPLVTSRCDVGDMAHQGLPSHLISELNVLYTF